MSIRQEIEALKDDDELIHCERIVRWAYENPLSELHRRLEWNNDRAGHKWRLTQARQLIRYHLVDNSGHAQVISLTIDRRNGGGYRDRVTVMNDANHMEVLRDEAYDELLRLKGKYDFFRELMPVWRAIESCYASREKLRKKGRRAEAPVERSAAS